MPELYKKNALSTSERFHNAIVVGVAAALAALAVGLLLFKGFGVYLPYYYIGAGYLIGLMIQKFGKGVQPKFSYLACLLAVAVIAILDLITFWPMSGYFTLLTGYGTTSLIEVACRIGGAYLAYMYARAVM